MTTFPSIGSKVQLISGGPIMTVSSLNSSAATVTTIWFSTTYELQLQELPLAVIKQVP